MRPPQPPSGTTGRRPRSLRGRLTLVVLAVTALVLAVSAVATYELTRRSLLDRVDDQLRSLAEGPAIAPLGRVPGDGVLVDRTPRILRADVIVAVSRPEGVRRVLPEPSGTELVTLTEAGLPADLPARVEAARGEPVLFTVATPRGEYRTVARAIDGTDAAIVFGQPLRDVDATLSRLVLILIAVGAVTMAGAGLAALALVRLGLRPLDRIATAADGIAAGDLSHRVGVLPGEPEEVSRVSRALDAMLDRIEEAFTRRRASEERVRRFAADASHELRTPLTSIRGYAELFRRGAAERPEDLAMAMSRIEAEAGRMSEIVESLLILARLDEAPEGARGPVWLGPLVRDVVAGQAAAHPDHAYAVTGGDEVVALGDEEQIRRAVLNLVANAGVHTPPGTSVDVSVAAREGAAVVEVSDDGPGLPPGDPAALFGRFVRGDPSRARPGPAGGPGGSGLGLAITEAIARRHGGAVAAGRGPGGGARFSLRLPLAEEGAEALRPDAGP